MPSARTTSAVSARIAEPPGTSEQAAHLGLQPQASEFRPSWRLDHDRLLDADEVAALLNVPVRWVRDHTRSGLIPHIPLGRYVRFRREAVLAWIAEQETGGAAWRKHRPRAPR